MAPEYLTWGGQFSIFIEILSKWNERFLFRFYDETRIFLLTKIFLQIDLFHDSTEYYISPPKKTQSRFALFDRFGRKFSGLCGLKNIMNLVKIGFLKWKTDWMETFWKLPRMFSLYFFTVATLCFHFGCSKAFKNLPRHLFDVDLINFTKRGREFLLERYAITRFVLWSSYTLYSRLSLNLVRTLPFNFIILVKRCGVKMSLFIEWFKHSKGWKPKDSIPLFF